jgi:hypothetical protein
MKKMYTHVNDSRMRRIDIIQNALRMSSDITHIAARQRDEAAAERRATANAQGQNDLVDAAIFPPLERTEEFRARARQIEDYRVQEDALASDIANDIAQMRITMSNPMIVTNNEEEDFISLDAEETFE